MDGATAILLLETPSIWTRMAQWFYLRSRNIEVRTIYLVKSQKNVKDPATFPLTTQYGSRAQ